MYNGYKIYGLPVALWPEFWTIRPELLEKTGMSAPQTLDAYLEQMYLYYANHAEGGEAYSFDGSTSIPEAQEQAVILLLSIYIQRTLAKLNGW